MTETLLLGDLTVLGSRAGGGDLGEVDLVYVPVPEPLAIALLVLGTVLLAVAWARRGRPSVHRRARRV